MYTPLIFIFLVVVAPGTTDAMFYYESNVLMFSPTNFGLLNVVSSLASIIGVWTYRALFTRSIISHRRFNNIGLGLSCMTRIFRPLYKVSDSRSVKRASQSSVVPIRRVRWPRRGASNASSSSAICSLCEDRLVIKPRDI